jgi:glycosyltransferase involved in cell wall biosynthesis
VKVSVLLEHRFYRTPDGAIWGQPGIPAGFFRRYLAVFDEVRVVARVGVASEEQPGWHRADDRGVHFVPVPYYLGPGQYLRNRRRIVASLRRAIYDAEAVILRVPSVAGTTAFATLRRDERPFGLEVVGDPFDVFAPGAIRHPLRSLFRWIYPRQLRQQCLHASAVAYVTESALQQRYPPSDGAVAINYSSVELSDEAYSPEPKQPRATGMHRVVTVGSLAHNHKGIDILIAAVGRCQAAGLQIELIVVGDGSYREGLEQQAAALGANVQFLGQVPAGAGIRSILDSADLFVLASRTEGLPRALIEAMARGLPCIATTAGGIPELLPSEDMVRPSDAVALADKIMAVALDAPRRASMAARNLERSKAYHANVLVARRQAFYSVVKERTELWLLRQKGPE